ncbi:DUF5063 domain-containing protein [Paraflavitalea sp. CAU 1676]|uniref:DUF5063 domain-containing protein n=1 Tax=Paraflavitalea sp. CAU 1676 TaxID=3032598 RepID=UPI0023DB8A98|nr:DUF5063 domain-containing protein [Paraflavitalea sp. CAU 1676]MDF2192310.1 DUF5063 domain-containing protein [Paraflavitalea sp. CAU 1676]
MLTSQPIKDFVATARAYCTFIETDQGHNPRQFLRTVQKDLLMLYRFGLDLPQIEAPGEVDMSHTDDKIHLDRVLRLIRDRVPVKSYWVTLTPLDFVNPTEIGTGDLVDDLGDIYLDLKRGLVLFDTSDTLAREYAVWYFRFHYTHHWGQHCIDALQIIHHSLNSHA